MKAKTQKIETVYDDENVKQAQAKLQELRNTARGLENQIEAERGSRTDEDLQAQAQALLDGKPFDDPRPTIQRLLSEKRVVDAAVSMAENALREAQQQAADRIIQQRQGDATSAAQRTAAALSELADAIESELSFYESVRLSGADIRRPAHWTTRRLVRDALLRGYGLDSANNPLRACIAEYKAHWQL